MPPWDQVMKWVVTGRIECGPHVYIFSEPTLASVQGEIKSTALFWQDKDMRLEERQEMKCSGSIRGEKMSLKRFTENNKEEHDRTLQKLLSHLGCSRKLVSSIRW